MSIRVSAIICTLNRAACLQKAIQSLVDQTLPKEQYEIIVVDNGSTDNTKATVEGFKRFENLRYIYEPVLGLSQARNTGWQNAEGEYVAYIDDDAIACPKWLESIVTAFETVKPQPGSVGGKVIPVWDIQPPVWFPEAQARAFAIIDWADNPTFLRRGSQFLQGCNVAYRREILRQFGGFSTVLGRKGSGLLGSEEILLQRFLMNKNLGIYYDPQICVEHHISAKGLTKDWVRRRYFSQGVSEQLLQHLETGERGANWHHLGQAVFYLSFFPSMLAMLLLAPIVAENPASRFEMQSAFYHWLGQCWGQLQIGFGRIRE